MRKIMKNANNVWLKYKNKMKQSNERQKIIHSNNISCMCTWLKYRNTAVKS